MPTNPEHRAFDFPALDTSAEPVARDLEANHQSFYSCTPNRISTLATDSE